MAEVVVVGSMNMDIVARVERFPEPGETMHALDTRFLAGGKGANQAVAAARAGAATALLGAVGMDAFGRDLVARLAHSHVDTQGILQVAEASTGTASITVDAQGRNMILLAAGANQHFTWEQVAWTKASSTADVWNGCKAVLLQHEIASDTNRQAVLECAKRGIPVFYNPAPAMPIDANLLSLIDTLILNEHEAQVLTHVPVSDENSANQASAEFLRQGVKSVIVTFGDRGCVYRDRQGRKLYQPAFSVQTVDTTAAGDTFIGAYAAQIVKGVDAETALKFASAAAALSVTKTGAQASIPTLEQVETFLKE